MMTTSQAPQTNQPAELRIVFVSFRPTRIFHATISVSPVAKLLLTKRKETLGTLPARGFTQWGVERFSHQKKRKEKSWCLRGTAFGGTRFCAS